MTTIETDTIIEVPTSVAVCPYCGAPLIARPEAWTQEDDGSWSASESGLECLSEPELDDSDPHSVELWEDWLAEHTVMPYVFMLPVDVKVLAWINANYRFRFQDKHNDE